MRQQPRAAVFFDLDGTFADTAPDLAAALNQVLVSHGQTPKPFAEIRPHVSHGGKAMIRLGFGLEPEDENFNLLHAQFLKAYQANICRHTRLFPGIEELLDELETRGITWGIVTNKPAWLTDPLLEQLGITQQAGCIVSGDTTPYSKPHPAPLLHACKTLSVQSPACLYVGDAQRDIEAGKNADMLTLVALFGYIADQDRPQHWGADGLISHPREILNWVNGGA